jgi:nucleoside-diphosphate-sugar epimerase
MFYVDKYKLYWWIIMRILVTGHRGYIGTILVKLLVGKGYEIIGIDKKIYQEFELESFDYEIQEKSKNIINIEKSDLKNVDAVIHLAALSNDPIGEINPLNTKIINEYGSYFLAKIAKKAGVGKFIFSSSCSIYGINETPVTEHDPVNPLTQYAKSKVAAEKAISTLGDRSFKTVILRNSTVHGYSPSLRMDLVVNNLTGWGYFTKDIKILSDGTPYRPLIHVNDLSRIFTEFIERNDYKSNELFNIGFEEENYQIKEIAEIIRNNLPDCQISIGSKDPDSRSYKVNFNKINNFIQPKNEFNVEKSVKELIIKMEDGTIEKDDFLNRNYSRIQQLKISNARILE